MVIDKYVSGCTRTNQKMPLAKFWLYKIPASTIKR